MPSAYQPPKYRKIAKPKRFLVIGNIQLGWDEDLLKTLANVAQEFEAQVVHLGNVCTDDEKRMYERRQHRIRTFEKIANEKEEQLQEEIQDLDTSDEKIAHRRSQMLAKYENLVVRHRNITDDLLEEVQTLEEAEKYRIQVLSKHFPNIKFVANGEQFLKGDHFKSRLLGPKFQLSKHLLLHSVLANGTKTTNQPITDRAFRFLKKMKMSVALAHPTPALRSYHREGLNKAWNMYTTGSLYYTDDPNRPSEYFKAVHMPSALLVSIDDVNDGEFHCSRLHFDFVRCQISHRIRPALMLDGQAFSASATWEVGPENTAIYSTDDHAPYEHRGVLASARSLVDLTKSETFINGGDGADWTSVCPHNAGKPLLSEGLRFCDDEASFKRLMAAQTDHPCIKTKVFIDANHEKWMDLMVSKLSFLKGLLDQASVYARAIPDWIYHIVKAGEDFTYYFGDLAIRHGHNVPSLTYALKIFEKYLGGHVHSHEELLRAGTAGAGAKLGPRFLENGITKWQNTITTLTRWSGKTSYDIKSVLHDDDRKVSRFSYRGNIYEVPWHVYEGEK